eukprot:TRINITY_DN19759_c0_g1_i2.p1 TRINITY_DN19759_c0_g1~~TRINITY_DN19759_c0_g1_i2.p1  ORF type:complete len:196 (+),score=15.23 TRINITY_DN19759_c0_g1_i2:87-590(+)
MCIRDSQTSAMQMIGIIGGLGWPSTVTYYQLLNQAFQRRLGGMHTPRLVIVQADLHEIWHHQSESQWEQVAAILTENAGRLKQAGADFFLVACNSVHTCDYLFEPAASLPLLHIVDPTAEQLLAEGHRTVGLLGSRWTMRDILRRTVEGSLWDTHSDPRRGAPELRA